MRILVVEDEVKIANALKKGLEQETYSVDIAFTGDEGYDLAVSESYDVIILDLMLPGMDGLEICENLRKDKIKTPILMLTAKGDLDDKVLGLNTGADDYLTKPFAFDELLARIKALLRRPNTPIENILVCGDLNLDLVRLAVFRNGNKIELSKKEFALLEYLMRNKNITVSKEQIISHVWNFDSDVLPNTVEQYINYLRNKIDKNQPDNKKIIKTVRGFGYMLKENNV